MKLRCKKEALYESGEKIMHFTKGEVYIFEKSYDPPGWEVEDDYGNKEVFFNTSELFEKL
jgi:hypothetical protein